MLRAILFAAGVAAAAAAASAPAVALSAFGEAAAPVIGYTLRTDGSYAVTMDGAAWLSSAPAGFTIRSGGATLSNSNGSLVADGPATPLSGADALGAFTGASLSFNAGLFIASFKLYAARNALVLGQSFPRGLTNMALPGAAADDDLATAFPAFMPPPGDELAYVSWTGCMCNGAVGLYGGPGSGANIGKESGPLALYNASGAAVTMSPGSGFMTAQLAHANIVNVPGCIASGHNGMVTDVPAGWSYDTVIVAGQGVNASTMAWGDILLARSGKTRTAPDADLIISTLGWWSDNGAYYYYLSEIGKTMQQTVVDALAYWKSLGLPTRHVMYDSWWYWKECDGAPQNTWLTCKGAVELWEPRNDVFPDGFNFNVSLPLALHNRWFSGTNNSYIDNLGFKDSFIVEPGTDFALPVKSDVFTYMMSRAQKWGMVLYEQDWLITVWESMKITKSSVTAGSAWLQAMADAATGLGITIQYCMPLPRHMLESSLHQAVTNARASGDYHPGASNFDIQTSSLFYWAIGVAPSKDDWWTTEVQPGSPYGDKPTEPNWQLEAITVGLSTGPNGPSDGIGFTNASLVMSTVRGDGLTLQPDRPATLMDAALLAVFTNAGRAPDVRSTWTAYLGHRYRWHHIYSTQLTADFTLALSDLGPLGDAPAYAVFDCFAPAAPLAVLASPSATFTVPAGQGQPSAPAAAHAIQHLVVIPQLPGGWWLFGEAGKVVPVSKQRIAGIALLADGFAATVLGAAGEAAGIDMLVAAPSAGGKLTAVHCPSAPGASAALTCTAGACSCA